MSVNWSWKHKMGEISVVRTLPQTGKQERFKLNIYSANCVAAVIYEFKGTNPNTGKEQDMYNFWCYWNDWNHLKRCLGLIKNFDGKYSNLYNATEDWDKWTKLKLNIYYKDMYKMAELFVKAGHKVELYYKEPKE